MYWSVHGKVSTLKRLRIPQCRYFFKQLSDLEFAGIILIYYLMNVCVQMEYWS